MFANLPILSLLIWLPLLGAGGVWLLGGGQRLQWARYLSYGVVGICLALVGVLWGQFDIAHPGMQLTESHLWIPAWNAFYAVGVDGLSLPLIALTCLMTGLALASGQVVKSPSASFYALFLLMQGLMCGAFAALDGVLFYVFWEAMLVPMFLIIGLYGGANRLYATLKFFLYTFFGSVLLLVALIYLHVAAIDLGFDAQYTFDIRTFQELTLSITAQKWLFMALLLAFAIKVPMWPFHTWLPDAHVEAPTGGSVVLAAVLLKMGAYGFLRFILPITFEAALYFAPLMIALSLIAILYIACVALAQCDLKKLIAYSSISHMGFVTLGFFVAVSLVQEHNQAALLALQGALMVMISHGLVAGALFLCVGVIYDRLHTRQISDLGGLANRMPRFATWLMVFVLANIGLPGTSGFVGEALVIWGTCQAGVAYGVLAAGTLILGAAYSLWMYKRVMYGPTIDTALAMPDLDRRERWSLGVLAGLILFLGLWPNGLLQLMQASSQQLLAQMVHLE